MNSLFKKTSYAILGLVLPFVSFAQGGGTPAASTGQGKTATELLKYFEQIIGLVVPIIIGAALLVFLWGVLRYFFSKDAKNRAESVTYIMWGLIALFVMVAIWGFVNLLQSAFLSDQNPSQPPRQEIQSLEKKPETNPSSFDEGSPLLKLIAEIGRILEAAIPVVMLLGILFVLWNIFVYAFKSDAKSKETARKYIVWGIVGLTVMAFVWSLVVYLQRSVFNGGDPSTMGEIKGDIEKLQSDPEQASQANGGGDGINKVIVEVVKIVDVAVPILITIGIVMFLWGVLRYIMTDSAKIKSEGLALMSWGIVVLLVMGSVWYFVNLLAETTDIRINQQPNIGEETVSPGELVIPAS